MCVPLCALRAQSAAAAQGVPPLLCPPDHNVASAASATMAGTGSATHAEPSNWWTLDDICPRAPMEAGIETREAFGGGAKR